MEIEKINGRTPEEIKERLECCSKESGCLKCPDVAAGDCSLKLCADALALIEHLEARIPKWISAEERLPENDDLVLVRANGRAREIRWDGAYALATYCGSEGWGLWDYEDDEVQHLKILQWAPMPEPPMEKERDVDA